MKIAVYYYLPYGGAKRAVFEQVKGLLRLNHIVDVYTLDKKKDEFSPSSIATNTFYYDFNIRKINLPIISRIYSDFQVFYTLKILHKKIAKNVDQREYDIVLAHTDSYTQSPFILQYLKTPSVYYCLEPLRNVYEYALRIPQSINFFNKIYEFLNRYIRRNLDRVNVRSAKYTLALSHFCRAYMIQVYDVFPNVSYLGVDSKLFKPLKIKKRNQILFIAGKDYLTGYDLIQNALKLIPKNKRPALKIVYGIGKKERITDEELVKVYNQSIATVSLSRLDTFGLVPLESMSCCVPVIATNVAGYRELVINKVTGFLVEFDPQDIADKIMYLINNPSEAEKIGAAGRRWVEKEWTWTHQTKILEEYLLSFIKRK